MIPLGILASSIRKALQPLIPPANLRVEIASHDPYWDNVLCLLNGTATEGIVDAKGRALSLFGSPAIVTNDPDFPDGAIYLDGTSYIRYEDNPSLWLILDSDFSIEFDYKPIAKVSGYPTIIGGMMVYSSSNNGFSIYDRHNGSPSKFTYAFKGQFPYQESSVIPTNGTKYSIQISYSSADGYIRFFINGVLQAQRISTGIFAVNGEFLFLGRQGDSADTYIKGLIGRFRITKGVARDTSNYIPETAPWPNVGPPPEPLPEVIGQPYGGGFYAGDIESGGQWYKLIVADVSAEITGTNSRWKTSNSSTPGTDHLTNGVSNTAAMVAAGIELHPAASHCIDHRGGGNADWYMPAKDELNVIYQNLGFNRPNCPPDFQAGGPQAFSNTWYWASTQYSSSYGWIQHFSNGSQSNYFKTDTARRVRPVRRLQFNP